MGCSEATLLARWCGGGASGGPVAPLAADTEERSARERKFSAKSKPPPPPAVTEEPVSDPLSETSSERNDPNEDKPRPCLFAVGGVLVLETEGRGLPFPEPPPTLPVLTSRRARAPKLSRRPKGVGGTLELPLGPSLSSNGLSSTEPEFALEMLSVRGRPGEKGELWFGEPDRPMVVRERRRRWA